jgi:hypothetical protein
VWQGRKKIRRPFEMWNSGGGLPWYKAYNETKHDRHSGFPKATFDHLIDAVCGAVTLLCGQISTGQYDNLMTVDGGFEGFHNVVGRYFTVRFPNDWPEKERYGFSTGEWYEMRNQEDPFQNFPYT